MAVLQRQIFRLQGVERLLRPETVEGLLSGLLCQCQQVIDPPIEAGVGQLEFVPPEMGRTG